MIDPTPNTAKTILVLGAFDTKSAEYDFLRQQILSAGCGVLCVDFGVMETGTTPFPFDVTANEVAQAAGTSLAALRSANDRGAAMAAMAAGATKQLTRLFDQGRFHGVIGMGGSGGTSVVAAAMRALPLGVPKVCVSTVAGGDTSAYVGTKDIVLIPSITDVSGVNRISRRVFAQAAAAICGMVSAAPPADTDDRPIIVASMFGNTTECVDRCRKTLDAEGFEVLVFHAVGSGGRTLETLIEEGLVEACLDITTTEWADEICGGVFAAGPDRLSAAGRRGIPHLIAPGCIDMVNFGPMDTVPRQYQDAERLFYEWNPSVTLMRTNAEENRRLGAIFAAKANAAKGPVAFLLPLRGVSILDGDGELFCDRDADSAMFTTLKNDLRSDIPVIEVDANINDPVFAQQAVEMMRNMLAT